MSQTFESMSVVSNSGHQWGIIVIRNHLLTELPSPMEFLFASETESSEFLASALSAKVGLQTVSSRDLKQLVHLWRDGQARTAERFAVKPPKNFLENSSEGSPNPIDQTCNG